MKLNSKILLLIIPLLILPIASIGWLAYQQLNETALNNSIQQSENTLHDISSQIQTFESNIHSNLKLFINDGLIQKYILTDEDSRYDLLLPALLRLFSSYQKAYPDYYEIRIILPDGFEDARMVNRDIDNITEDESNNPIAVQFMNFGTNIISFFSKNPDTQQFAYYASKAIIIRDRAFDSLTKKPSLRGFLSVTVDTDWLKNKINNTIVGHNGHVFLASKEGIVLLANNHQDLITTHDDITKKVEDNNSRLYITKSLNHKVIDNKQIININNTNGYLWSAPISENLILFTWHPTKEIQKQSINLALKIIIISILSALFMSFAVYQLLNHLILKPIHELQSATKHIGRGDLKKSIPIRRNDEIGMLSRSFNEMSQNLLRSNEQIKYLAYHDDLTGLPNRLMFHEYVTQGVAFAKRNNEKLAILFIDLDNFKRVNDTLGHKAGDVLLKEVSDRILGCLRDTDYMARSDNEMSNILARIGGDEFLIMLHNMTDTFIPAKISKRIISVLSSSITLDKNEFFVSASLGISMYPDDANTPDDLIKYADMAMYHAKDVGKNNYQYYTESMNMDMHERFIMEKKLRAAIADNQLFLHFQPQFSSITGEIYGVEALIRWNDPELGFISPATFIPLAEETGLIIDIGKWVLFKACHQVKTWQTKYNKKIKVSVNISAVQFSKTNLPGLISAALDKTGLEPCYLDIEITETTIMENIGRVNEILNKIRNLGVLISLDDFGKGYSSLNYLRNFPIDILKIDRSFVNEISDKDNKKSAIVIAIIAMSHALNLKVIAEGVETESQNNKLNEWGCDYIQGFLLARPLPTEEFEELLIDKNISDNNGST